MKHFISDEFTWAGNHGSANASTLFGDVISEFPSRFTITSTKTGKCRTYELEAVYTLGNAPRAVYTDNLWDGTSATIFNN